MLIICVVIIEHKLVVNLMFVSVIKGRNNSFILTKWELEIISLIGLFAKDNLAFKE